MSALSQILNCSHLLVSSRARSCFTAMASVTLNTTAKTSLSAAIEHALSTSSSISSTVQNPQYSTRDYYYPWCYQAPFRVVPSTPLYHTQHHACSPVDPYANASAPLLSPNVSSLILDPPQSQPPSFHQLHDSFYFPIASPSAALIGLPSPYAPHSFSQFTPTAPAPATPVTPAPFSLAPAAVALPPYASSLAPSAHTSKPHQS